MLPKWPVRYKLGISCKVASEWKYKVGVSNKVARGWTFKVQFSQIQYHTLLNELNPLVVFFFF